MPPHPARILFLRPDAYGDLFLFEPVPRIVRDAWPQAEVAVLIRKPYADAIPLLTSPGVHWLTTDCNPYRDSPGENPAALVDLRETVRAFAPDLVVAGCAEQTWLEAAVAAFLPAARQISLGYGLTDPLTRAALDAVVPVDWQSIYPERIPVEQTLSEWEKNLHLATALLGHEAPRWWPVATVPADAGERAAQIVVAAGLVTGEFVACAAAGTANVPIKHWPAEHYGETLASLEREPGIRALLIGHVSERAHLEHVQQAARQHGGDPALWLGQDGEMPIVAGLLKAARFYFGNDTGALHLAAALGQPVVPVFGGGTWPRFQPVARRSLTVVQPLPCFGCAWDCYFVDAPCVRTISPASVQRALAQFLADDVERQVIFEAEGLPAGARALIDTATPQLRFQRADSVARLRQTKELTALLNHSETDRDSRLRQVDELTAQLRTSETDRDAREAQVKELTALLNASETDRDAREVQVKELTALLNASETDRDAREAQVKELTAFLQASEADRDARGKQVAELLPLLETSDADRADRQAQVVELTDLLQASEADRDARGKQVAELLPLLKTSDADRADRGRQVAELTSLLQASEIDREARGKQISQLTAWLLTSNADREAQAQHTEELTARLKTNEADLAAQGKHIAELTAKLEAREADIPGKPFAEQAAPDAMGPTDPAPRDEQGLPAESPLLPSTVADISLPVRLSPATDRVKQGSFS